MNKIKVVFAGTPAFAVPALTQLMASDFCEVCAVLTQPDRPAGRGRQLQRSPIGELAIQHQLPLYQPLSLKDPQILEVLKTYEMDVLVVVAYGLIIPPALLALPKRGCLNIHASLLPRWRGAAPIQYALLAGDALTGVTIMQMEAGLDTGPILLQAPYAIKHTDTSLSLQHHLSNMGASLLMEALPGYVEHRIPLVPQIGSEVTYAPKIEKTQAQLDWTLSAEELHRQIRGFNPWPISYTPLGHEMLRIWEAELLEGVAQTPGEILEVSAEGIVISTGQGLLRVTIAQLPGKKPHRVAELLNAYGDRLKVGTKL